ncbi:MAG: hypothetical protein DRP60_13245 [Spirochaetes bacterium]|nr:MAG: hypothetical protein DRP60_13245 [Spirochaetota bacterium]
MIPEGRKCWNRSENKKPHSLLSPDDCHFVRFVFLKLSCKEYFQKMSCFLRDTKYQDVFYSEGRDCKAFTAPFDVMLPDFPIGKEDEIDTVVQPDMSVICDSSKIMDKGCLGAPDLIIEILSPSTSKKELYEKHG